MRTHRIQHTLLNQVHPQSTHGSDPATGSYLSSSCFRVLPLPVDSCTCSKSPPIGPEISFDAFDINASDDCLHSRSQPEEDPQQFSSTRGAQRPDMSNLLGFSGHFPLSVCYTFRFLYASYFFFSSKSFSGHSYQSILIMHILVHIYIVFLIFAYGFIVLIRYWDDIFGESADVSLPISDHNLLAPTRSKMGEVYWNGQQRVLSSFGVRP